jgi:diguanylate cyclase (GGDEF)-like protein
VTEKHTNDTPISAVHELVVGEIERLSRKGFEWLTLPALLERSFESSTAAARAARFWVEGLIAIGLFNFFILADYLIRGNVSWLQLQMRLCVITPIALLINATMRLNPNRVYREASVAVATCAIALAHLYLESNKNPAASAYAQVGLILAVIFVNVVMRLQLPYALTASAVLLVGDLLFMGHDHFLNNSQKLLGMTLAACATSMTIVGNYSMGREERLGFLMRLRSDMQSKELSFVNAELKRISIVDRLTGLANRHSYEAQFGKLWREAIDAGTSLSLIVIDIDNFKTVNDSRGHLYGDRVLARVASLLSQGLRGKADFAARFGGEEFVVLLPGTSQSGALIVAERVRKLVEVAGSPAQEDTSSYPPLTTVSCGVSTCWPTEAHNREDLLDTADKALYEAKNTGRNRVCCGEVPVPPKKWPSSATASQGVLTHSLVPVDPAMRRAASS